MENLLCLLSNAVKYSDKGATIEVSTELKDKINSIEQSADKEDDTQQNLTIMVADTGIGISNEKQMELFKPFKQAQRLAGGTGLGLFAMSKRMEALGGECGVRGRQGNREYISMTVYSNNSN